MALITFGNAKNSIELKSISGVCGTSDQFKSMLNQAVEALMTRGNFFGTVQKLHVCVADNCVAWPRWVGTILATNICGRHVPQKDFWWDFLQVSPDDWGCLSNNAATGPSLGQACGGTAVFENAGTTPVFSNVPCNQNFYLRVYPSSKSDIGKTITIFGIDSNGQVIRTIQNGVLQEGIVMTMAVPFSVTPITIRRIDRVVKDKTQGVVRLYFFDAINNVLWDCASYDPQEINPQYQFSRLKGIRNNQNRCGTSTCNPVKSIDALVKMQHIPVEFDNDLVQIESLRAIKKMIQCIRAEDSGDISAARAYEQDAFRELNYNLRDKFPIEQFTYAFRPFGSAALSRRIGGFI